MKTEIAMVVFAVFAAAFFISAAINKMLGSFSVELRQTGKKDMSNFWILVIVTLPLVFVVAAEALGLWDWLDNL